MPRPVWVLTSRDNNAIQVHESKQIFDIFTEKFGSTVGFREVFIEDVFIVLKTGSASLFIRDPKANTTEEIPSSQVPQVCLVRLLSAFVNIDRETTVLRQLELMGTRLINPIRTIQRLINKTWHLQDLALAGVPIAPTISYGKAPLAEVSKFVYENADHVPLPCVVKNVRGSGGRSVFVVPDIELLQDIQHVISHETPYLFQKIVENSRGRDVRVIVIGGEIMGAMYRQNPDKFQSNVRQGGQTSIFEITDSMRQVVGDIVRVLELDIGGIDLLFGNEGEWGSEWVVCEVNNNFGFKAFDRTLGCSIAVRIAQFIESIVTRD
eukprot:GILI01004063.1.p1 GENE.GILI01004063.1~~GILI01004063.1.p1  ORF type:complete len:337 (+),score=59.99 GILI01004063.1:47-1012(+)